MMREDCVMHVPLRISDKTIREKLRTTAGRVGAVAYGASVFALAGVGLWLVLTLSNANTFAEARHALAVPLSSITSFFGMPPASAAPPIVVAEGEVVAVDELDVLAPHTGTVIAVYVANKEDVTAGSLLVRMSDPDVRAGIRSIEEELADARSDLKELSKAPVETEPPSLIGTHAALSSAFHTLARITPAHERIVNDEEMRTVLSDVPAARILHARAKARFGSAQDAYSEAHILYRAISEASSREDVIKAAQAAQSALKAQESALKATGDFLAFVDANAGSDGRPAALSERSAEIAHVAAVNRESLETLESVLAKANPPGPSGAEIAAQKAERAAHVREAESRVAAAEADLIAQKRLIEEYTIRAPTSGTISELDAKAGKKFLEGEILATIASPQNVVRIEMSDSDIKRLRVGQSAFVTFDNAIVPAVPGTVIHVEPATDALGVVYVGFAEDEERPRPGMSVTAHITAP